MSTFEDQAPQAVVFTMPLEFKARVHNENDSLWAEIEEMPGCFASGDSMAELGEALSEAMSLYLSSTGVTITINELHLVPVKQADRLLPIEGSGDFKVLVGAVPSA